MKIIDLLQKFEKYLLIKKQVAINTFNFYLKDINSFLAFIKNQNKDLNLVNKQDIKNYFENLINSHEGKSAAVRKKSAINCFFKYLYKYHEFPDLSIDFNFFSKFPLLISNQEIELAINKTLKKIDNIDTPELRNLILIMLIYYSNFSIKTIVNLEFSNFKLDKLEVTIKNKIKSIYLPKIFFEAFDKYKSKQNINTTLVFPIQKSNNIEPIAYSSVWPIIKNFLNINKEQNNNIINKNNIDYNINKSFIDAYKKSHPRS